MIRNIIFSEILSKNTGDYLYHLIKVINALPKRYKTCLSIENKRGRIEEIGVVKTENKKISLCWNSNLLRQTFIPVLKRLKTDNTAQKHYLKLADCSSRNILTHTLLKIIFKYQKNFFLSKKPQDLKPLTLQEIKNKMEPHSLPVKITSSILSRLTRSVSLKFNDRNHLLTFFLPSDRYCLEQYLQQILRGERNKFIYGEMDTCYSDRELALKIFEKYGLKTSRKNLARIRNNLNLPNSFIRKKQYNEGLREIFSPLFEWKYSNLNQKAPETGGIYEIHTDSNSPIKYKDGKTTLIYIGSSKNIRNRLRAHHNNGRNQHLYAFISQNNCRFRYSISKLNWQMKEYQLFKHFELLYNTYPLCNSVRPYY
jgi:hypothetical protein